MPPGKVICGHPASKSGPRELMKQLSTGEACLMPLLSGEGFDVDTR
ncbi:MAG: hypothetical protein ACI9UU_000774 [Candidatus Azotimanducaceae bacterium]|jgi:hypothetical protein